MFAGHWLLCVFLLKPISVRSLVIDCLALYLKGTEIFLLLKTISVRYLVIDCLALYLKGTEIFLFLPAIGCSAFFSVEDDFSAILGYRLLGLIFERY